MPRAESSVAARVLLVLLVSAASLLPVVHQGQAACVQHDALGRVVSRSGTPATCAGKTCGVIPDGCGGTLSCGTCGPGQSCTASNSCCTMTSCAGRCGTMADGCGGTQSCGA